MIHENIIKLLTGVKQIARESTNILKESSINFIEQSIIKGHYTSREEYEQLKQLVFKMQEEIKSFKKK